MDPAETKALNDITTYGCHVIHVLEEEDLPPFSYSVGIERSSHAPELLVIGLKRELAHSIINRYNHRVRRGEAFEHGHVYSDFIEGFGCEIRTSLTIKNISAGACGFIKEITSQSFNLFIRPPREFGRGNQRRRHPFALGNRSSISPQIN